MSSYRKTPHQRTGLTRRLALAFLPSLLGLLLVAGALGGIAGLAGVYGWRPQLPVGLLTGEGADQALASRTALLLLVVAVGLLGVALVTLVALQFNRRIRRPLSHLTAVARAVAAGDLQRRAHLRRADEIGALSGDLDALAGQLQDLTATLDDRVAERTQSLEGRAARLLTAAEVGLELAPILDLGALGQRAVDLVADLDEDLQQADPDQPLAARLESWRIRLQQDLPAAEHAESEETPQHDAENCPFCRAKKKKLLASTALVQVVDAQGSVPAVDARKLLGLEEGQIIVLRGEAQIDGLGNLAVRAARVYVRPPPPKTAS